MKRVALLAIVVLMAGRIAQASEPISPIEQAMTRIRDKKVEHMVVFNSAGDQIAETVGSEMEASSDANVSLSNTTVLHNHLISPWISEEDYKFAEVYHVKRMIAIAPVKINTYRMYVMCMLVRIDDRWPTFNEHEFTNRTHQVGHHKAWTEFAVKHGIAYRCEVLPP